MAYIIAGLIEIEHQLENVEIRDIYNNAEIDLNDYVTSLLNGTADHYEEIKEIIKSLSSATPKKILSFIELLNTSPNRYLSMLYFVQNVCEKGLNSENISIVNETLSNLEDIDYFDEAMVFLMESFVENDHLDDQRIGKLMPIINKIFHMHHNEKKCRALCLGIIITSNSKKYNSLNKAIVRELKKTWDNIDVGWYKVDIGFRIITTLAEYSLSLAQEYLENILIIRK